MTVKELKEIIKDIPDDVVVFVNGYAYDYNMAYCNGKIENYSYVKDASSPGANACLANQHITAMTHDDIYNCPSFAEYNREELKTKICKYSNNKD